MKAPVGAPDRGQGHGTGRRLFHWLTVLLVGITLPVGIAMTSEGFRDWSDALYITHKGMGVVIGIVLVLRLAWRWVTPPPPPLPDTVSPLERRLAGATHAALYGVLALLVATGYVRTVTGGFPIELLDALGVPPLLPERPDLSRALSVVHSFAGYAFVFLLALHVGAVARHALVVRDGVFARMWPPWRSAGRDAP